MVELSDLTIDHEDSERFLLVKSPATETFQVIHFLFWLTVTFTTLREASLVGLIQWTSWASLLKDNPWWMMLFAEAMGMLTLWTGLAWLFEKKLEINNRNFCLSVERRLGFCLLSKKHYPFHQFKAIVVRRRRGWPEQWELRLVFKKKRELRIDRSAFHPHIQNLAAELARRMMLPLLP